MKARHAARELALLTLFQLDQQEEPLSLDKINLRDLILFSVRALVAQARDQIKSAADNLASVSRTIIEMEMEHPSNLETPIGVEAQPVPIPTTREMVDKIESCLQGAEYLFEALRIPELAAFAKMEDMQDYTIRLIRLVCQHQKELEGIIDLLSEDWKVERLIKTDRLVLLLAMCEMKYVGDVDLSVSINEAVELAKRFSAAESYRYINGILGRFADYLEGKAPLPTPPVKPQEEIQKEELPEVLAAAAAEPVEESVQVAEEGTHV